MNILKKITNIISLLIITVLSVTIIFLGIIFVQSKMHPDMVPNLFGYKPFIVLSGSMETEIDRGDLVIVKVSDYNNLNNNEIITFKSPDGYMTTHRIVDKKVVDGEIRYTTKGDNNTNNDDGYVLPKNIEGVFVKKYAGVGNFVLFLQKPITLFAILLIIVLIAIILWLNDRNKLTKEALKELEMLKDDKKGIKSK